MAECVIVDYPGLQGTLVICAASGDEAVQIALSHIAVTGSLLLTSAPSASDLTEALNAKRSIELSLTFEQPNPNGPHRFKPVQFAPRRSRHPWYRRQVKLPIKQPRST